MELIRSSYRYYRSSYRSCPFQFPFLFPFQVSVPATWNWYGTAVVTGPFQLLLLPFQIRSKSVPNPFQVRSKSVPSPFQVSTRSTPGRFWGLGLNCRARFGVSGKALPPSVPQAGIHMELHMPYGHGHRGNHAHTHTSAWGPTHTSAWAPRRGGGLQGHKL